MAKTKNGTEVENGDKSSTESTTASLSSSAGAPTLPPESDNISTRVGTRTKKAKVVFDPSDNYIPRKRVRKADLLPSDSPVGPYSSKLDHLVPKSPSKSDTPMTADGNVMMKSRPTLSPATLSVASKQITTSYSRPKVLGGGPSSMSSSSSDATRLAGSAGGGNSGLTVTGIKREPNCDMCHKVEQQRRGFKLVDCCSCAFRAHSKCLRAHPVYQKFPIRFNFRCFQCIECVVCGKSLRGGNLLFCCDCHNAFHANCHGPSNSDSPWLCKRCLGVGNPTKQSRSQPEKQSSVADRPESADNADDEAHQEFAGFSDNEIRKDSFSLSDSGPANDSAVQPDDTEDDDEEGEEDDDHQNEDEEEEAEETEQTDQNDTTEENNDVDNDEEKFDPRLDNFEDIQNWSCEDVYQYFKHYFPDYAHLFKEQEIDGPSLVLMRKSDVLSGFGLKLGPAIALYQRIVMMQNNDRDFRLTWI